MAGGTVGTVRARLRLPTVAECAELLAAGWTPLLGRLGVWVDDSGDGWGRCGGRGLWRSRDGTGAGLAPMAGEARHDAPGRAILADGVTR